MPSFDKEMGMNVDNRTRRAGDVRIRNRQMRLNQRPVKRAPRLARIRTIEGNRLRIGNRTQCHEVKVGNDSHRVAAKH